MQTISLRTGYAHLVAVVTILSGIAFFVVPSFVAVDDFKIGTLQLHLPEGLAALIIRGLGALMILQVPVMYALTWRHNQKDHKITLAERSITFPRHSFLRLRRSVEITLGYEAITKVVITKTDEENKVEFVAPSKGVKAQFDADEMTPSSDIVLVSTLKRKAANATFKAI